MGIFSLPFIGTSPGIPLISVSLHSFTIFFLPTNMIFHVFQITDSEIIIVHHHSWFGISIYLQSNIKEEFPCLLCYNCTQGVTAGHIHKAASNTCAESVVAVLA